MSEYATIEVNGYPIWRFRNILDKKKCGFFSLMMI